MRLSQKIFPFKEQCCLQQLCQKSKQNIWIPCVDISLSFAYPEIG